MEVSDFRNVAAKPDFSYERNPVLERSFLILKKDRSNNYLHVGDYTVLDPEEDIFFAEKKVINLVSLLNGKKELIDLGHETDKRLLFHRKNGKEDTGRTEVVFYALGNTGVSRENAVLTLEEGNA